MRDGETKPSSYRFGNFELDTRPGELHKNGTRIRLQDQPMQVLLLLLEHAGELVTREQIQKKLWASDTFVDFDNAINSAMRKLREALSDDSGDPRFIETMARRGYRFIGSIDMHPPDRPAVAPEPAPAVTQKPRKALVVSICGVILVLSLAASWWFWTHRPVSEMRAVPLAPVPLTAAAGYEAAPSPSPDGNQVAYVWDEGKGAPLNDHIYVKLIGEGKPVRLTSGPHYDEYPAWSPDGRTIAFVGVLGETNRIYVIPALGGAERQVVEGPFAGARPLSWSPDGRFLAVAELNSGTNAPSVSLVSIEDGSKVPLMRPPDAKTADTDPVFSPDGRLLLFTRCGEPLHCGLYLLDLGADYRPSGGPRLLRQENGHIRGAAWTANSNEVVYALSGDAGINHHLMRIRARAGSQPERLTSTSERTDEPAVAARGNRLFYRQVLSDVDIWQIHPGGQPASFIASTRWEYAPQYSPDGHRVAFGSNRSGLMQVWACDGDGVNPVQLTRFELGGSGTPRWSPDGHWIAFDHQGKEGWRIYVMASDGGQVRILAPDEGDSVIPSWSGDGKWIYYSSDQTGRFEIWKRASQGGQGVQLTRTGGWVAFESHDGQSLYYTKGSDSVPDQELWVLPLRGGAEKKVLESVWLRAFVVTEDGIYYIQAPGIDGNASVRFRSFATSQDEEIARIKHPFQGLTVSPDRKTILFSANVRSGGNVMVVDNFR